MKKTIISSLLFCATILCYAQEPIEITDQTLKVSGEENVYFGFAAGDEIILSLEEVSGKDLKEVEVLLYPDKVVYSNFKVSSLEKTIRIQEEGVYQFRLKHSGMGSRICRFSINRIPAPDMANFSTTVEWVEKIDTTYKINTQNVTIGYETKQIERVRKIVASVDTTIETIVNRTERVHSSTNINGNQSGIQFTVPVTVHEPNYLTPYKTTEAISWAYAISTGATGDAWYKDANAKAAATDITKTMVTAGLVSTGYGALAVLAIEGVSVFSSPPKGDNVRFEVITAIDGVNYAIAKGNSVVAFDKITQYRGGGYYLRLTNDNVIDAINVDVKIIAVLVTTTYKDETYIETKQVPIKEKQVIQTVKDTETVLVPVISGN